MIHVVSDVNDNMFYAGTHGAIGIATSVFILTMALVQLFPRSTYVDWIEQRAAHVPESREWSFMRKDADFVVSVLWFGDLLMCLSTAVVLRTFAMEDSVHPWFAVGFLVIAAAIQRFGRALGDEQATSAAALTGPWICTMVFLIMSVTIPGRGSVAVSYETMVTSLVFSSVFGVYKILTLLFAALFVLNHRSTPSGAVDAVVSALGQSDQPQYSKSVRQD